jgi:hypothetical protein
VWVKVPEISSNENTYIYLYFGDIYLEEENSTEVWDNNFIIVQHLNENPANDINGFLDSTNNEHNGMPVNFDNTVDSNTNCPGIIDKAVIFDRYDDYIQLSPSSEIFNNTEFTASVWFKTDYIFGGYGIEGRLFNFHRLDTASSVLSVYLGGSSSKGAPNETCLLYYTGSSHVWSCAVTDPLYSDNNFHNIYVTYKDSNLNLYYDTQNIISTITDLGTAGNYPLFLGTYDTVTSQRKYKGIIDEFKYSNILRSNSWLKAEYYNINDPSSFYSIENKEEFENKLKFIVWINVPNLSDNENTIINMYFGNNNTNEINESETWDYYFTSVHHFNETPIVNDTTSFLDSTRNNNNATPKNFNFNFNLDSSTEINGIIGRANLFDGEDDYIIVPNSSSDKLTFSYWIKKDFTNYRRNTLKGGNTTGGFINVFSGSSHGVYIPQGTPLPGYHYGSGIIADEYNLLTWTYDKNTLKIYTNGELKNTVFVATDNDFSSAAIHIGRPYGNATEDFKGIIDEL